MNAILGLPEHTLSDLAATAMFGVVAVLLVAFGCKVADWVWRQLDLEEQVQKGNIAAGIVMASCVLGFCYVMATVAKAVIGG